MKKLLQKINTRSIRSIVAGIVLAGMMGMGTSFVQAQLETSVVPFLGPSSGLLSRIGSLTIGNSTTASWMQGRSTDCINTEQIGTESCLDVTGVGTFSNLVVNQIGRVVDTLTLTTANEYTNGEGGFAPVGIIPTLLIEDDPLVDDEGMIVQGLGYEVNGVFSPRDITTERELCSDSSGQLIVCGSGGGGLAK
ncbi:hypothetical protein KC866_01850 [Patescibacteria group bacterium]|nr:hypothetical protein [Patescibacteria group bacterium]